MPSEPSLKVTKRNLSEIGVPEQPLMQSSVGYFMENSVPISERHENTSQETILVTKDKVKLCLWKHLRNIGRKKEWRTKLSLPIALSLALLTSNFDSVSWLHPELVRSSFILVLLYSSYRVYQAWQFSLGMEEPRDAVNTIIEEISGT